MLGTRTGRVLTSGVSRVTEEGKAAKELRRPVVIIIGSSSSVWIKGADEVPKGIGVLVSHV